MQNCIFKTNSYPIYNLSNKKSFQLHILVQTPCNNHLFQLYDLAPLRYTHKHPKSRHSVPVFLINTSQTPKNQIKKHLKKNHQSLKSLHLPDNSPLQGTPSTDCLRRYIGEGHSRGRDSLRSSPPTRTGGCLVRSSPWLRLRAHITAQGRGRFRCVSDACSPG